ARVCRGQSGGTARAHWAGGRRTRLARGRAPLLGSGVRADPLRRAPLRARRRTPRDRLARALAPLGKALPQQRRGRLLAAPRIDLGPMEALRLVEHARTVLDGAALRVGRAVIEASDSRMRAGPGAHRAGFERNPQLATVEPLVAERGG